MADKFIWYELITRDQDKASAFYGKVVGWSAADHENSTPESRYVILAAGERGIGGMMGLTDRMCDGGARPGWVGYIGVTDTDASAASIAEAGGRVLMEPGDIPNVGRFAMVADPGGAPFYLLTPSPREGEQAPADPDLPGLISWHELYAGNGEKAAFDFYSKQFGWETMEEMSMGPMGTYRIFGADGVQMGGMMDKPENVPDSRWGFYFNVVGIDSAVERVEAEGGRVTVQPHQVPGGSWIIQATDPEGVNFALVSTTR